MASASWPRVAVVGAGAVGGYFGGMLARAGAHVTLIGRPVHVDVWTRDGLFLDSLNFQETIPVAASTEVAASGDADLVLFSVKSLDTEETARQLARHVRGDALIVSLQNGVDNVERIRAAAALDPIAAVVYVASSMPAPGRVKHGGRGDLLIGDLPGRSGPPREAAVARVSAWFEAAGVPCPVSPNIDADLWTKLITNAGLNAISAVARATYGDIVAIPESRETIRQLVNECVAVARAGGVSLPAVDFVQMVWRFADKVGQIYASTAQDLDRGKRTEIDALNGFVVRRGAELGVPTPVNQALLALVKLREAQFERAAAMHTTEAAAAEPYFLRKATSNDVGAVARIWHIGWTDGHVGHVPPELVRCRNQEQFVSRARARVDCMWVAESHSQTVGFVVVKGDEVEQIYVDRTARGTGVAAMLLRKAEAEIRSAGHRRAWLAVVAGNQRARSFYSRQGWRDSGPMSYLAETEVGPLPVPSHRYEIDLTDPALDDPARH